MSNSRSCAGVLKGKDKSADLLVPDSVLIEVDFEVFCSPLPHKLSYLIFS